MVNGRGGRLFIVEIHQVEMSASADVLSRARGITFV